MNRLTPYEQSIAEQLNDIPMPSPDEGWKEMSHMLDREKRDRFIPPINLKGCAFFAAFLILLVIGGFYLWNAAGNKEQATASSNSIKKPVAAPIIDHENPGTNQSNIPSGKNDPESRYSADGLTVMPQDVSKESLIKQSDLALREDQRPDVNFDKTTKQQSRGEKKWNNKRSVVNNKISQEELITVDNNIVRKLENKENRKSKEVNAEADIVSMKAETTEDQVAVKDKPDPKYLQTDSLKKSIDTAAISIAPVVSEPVKANPGKRKERNPVNMYVTAGVSVYKGIPLNGTVDHAVNFSGKEKTATDYIPSFYLRLYHKKWFLQGEFRYAVPQYSDGFVYKEERQRDSTSQNTLISTYKLRKMYYHQVPLSINYQLNEHWSIGTGIIYNRFRTAVSSEAVKRANDRLVNDSLISFTLVADKQDPSFVKNSFQWLMEFNYTRNRFNAGARYAQGLAPFIKYTDINNNLQSKKNNSLFLFLRYQLWTSKKEQIRN